jgi:hypothetical protein
MRALAVAAVGWVVLTTGTGVGQPCDDRIACTIEDQCRDGRCAGTQVECPDDGDACTREFCRPSTGVCEVESVDCGGPCLSGACDPATGCLPRPDGTPCDDANACTTDDRCRLGFCRGSPVDDGTPCTDSFGPCSANDRCQRGSCLGDFVECPDSDGDRCTPEFCDFGTGLCRTLPRRSCVNPCEARPCDPRTGECAAMPDDLPCDDNNACAVNDRCVAGTCRGDPLGVTEPTPTVAPATPVMPSPTPGTPAATPSETVPPTPTATATAAPSTPTATARGGRGGGGCAVGPPPRGPGGVAFALAVVVVTMPRLRASAPRAPH